MLEISVCKKEPVYADGDKDMSYYQQNAYASGADFRSSKVWHNSDRSPARSSNSENRFMSRQRYSGIFKNLLTYQNS